MSSTNTLNSSNLLKYHSTERLEKLLDDPIKPHPDIIWNTSEQVLLAETRQEPFTETFYHWVNISKNNTLHLVRLVHLRYEAPGTQIAILDAALRTYSVRALTQCVRAHQAQPEQNSK